MAKTETKALERTYTVPLRREYLKVPNCNRTKKAVLALRQFLAKHMKSEDVRLSTTLNNELWKHGIKNPPHHVKVTVSKDEKGAVTAELFGVQKEEQKVGKKTTPAQKESKSEADGHQHQGPAHDEHVHESVQKATQKKQPA